ncbi:MAG TPA: translocation/assembly module TamB domain-containing protein [Vicinamibacterales bacterium]|nr:translocation/assembly module TamB domain-containing protein [Vicinamibacterales bacterium]
MPENRPLRRRRFHRLRVFGGVLCIVAVLTFVAVHTPPARRFATNQVIALLAREQIEFSTDQLGYNLLGASFNLRNVRIRSTTRPDAPVFATIGRLRINMSLLQLLRGRYVVQSGSVEDVDVHYVVDEQGRDNVPRPPSDPNKPSEPLDYLVSSLTVSRAKVRYENRADQIDARLPVSSINVTGNDVTNRHLIKLDAAGGEVMLRDRRAAIDRLTGQIDLGRDDASIDQLQLEALGSRAEVTGDITRFESPVADLTVKSTVDAMQVAPLARLDDPVSGSIVIDGTAKGPLSTPAINAHVIGSDLQFRDLRNAQLDALAAYDLATRRADVSSFQFRGPWGGVMGAGSLSSDEAAQSRLNADINALDVATIMRALRLPFVAATRVDGKVQAEWPGLEYLKANGDATATLTATAAQANRSTMPVEGQISAHGTGGRIDAQFVKVVSPGGEVAGRVAITNDKRLDGDLKARSGDVSRLVSVLEAFLGRPRGSMLPTTVEGAAEINARVGGTIDAPSATSTVSAPALKVGTVDGIAVKAEASYSPAALDIVRADLTWNQARAQVNGRVGLDRARRIDLSLTADQLDLPTILQALNKAGVPVSGTLSARGTVGGTLDRPIAAINAQGSDLVAYQEQIGSLAADLRLDGRELSVPNLVIDKPQPDGAGRLSASGTYQLDRKTYTFEVKSDGVRLVGLMLPNGQRLRGDVQLIGHGAGSVDSPAGTVDLDATQLQLNDTLLGRVAVKAVAANDEATITASAEHFNIDGDAVVGLTKPFPSTVKVRVDDLDLGRLPSSVRLPSTALGPGKPDTASEGLGGHVRATIDASGNLSEPEEGKATVALEAFNGSWNRRAFTISSPSPIEYADKRLTVDRLQVAAEGSSLTVGGQLPLSDEAGTGELSLDLRGSLATLANFAPPDRQIAADGEVTMTGSLKGTLKRIDPTLDFSVSNGLLLSRFLEPGFSHIGMKARVADGEARVEQLSATWGTATLEGTGRIPLEAIPALPVEMPRMSGPSTFKASIKGLNPASIPGAPTGTAGNVTVDAELSANRPELSSIDGRVTFEQLDVSFNGLGLAQQQPSTITIGSGAATIDQLDLSGTAGTIKAGGRVELVGDRAIDLNVDGKLDVGALSVLTNRVRAEGDSALSVRARGTVSDPELTGTVDVTNATFVSNEPRVAGENLNAHIDLNGKQIELTKLAADVNGGTLTGSGSVTLGEGVVSDIDIQLATKGFAYDAPLDLRSISDANIRINRRRNDDIVIGGEVTIREAGLTSDIDFDTGLLATMAAPARLDLTEKRNPLLDRVRFNLNVDTATPILVDNNLARAELETDLRVVGTAYQPGLLGEVRLLEGSEIRLNERRYVADPSTIQFLDERRILPSFDLNLTTQASNYDITVAVTGTPGNTEATFTSDPSLPEPDIMAMLITGRTLDEMRGEEGEVAREQVLSYMAGRVGNTLGRGLQQATGLSEVRIEPTLIANEADPSARLTVGQRITDQLKLVYSTNLTDSNDQIWVAEFDLSRRFQMRGVRQSDNSYRGDFRHDVRFGGQADPRRVQRVQPRVESVTVMAGGADEAQLREAFGIKAGDPFDFFKIRNAVQRVEESLMEQGYLQARVRLERQVENDLAQLVLNVTRGPIVDVRFMGTTPPSRVQREIRRQWHRGVFDKQRGDDATDSIREWLLADRHFQPKIEYHLEDVADGKRVVTFQIEPGMRSRRVVLVFEGASAVSPDTLDRVISQQRLERRLFTDPTVVTELLQRFYRELGFLAAEIDEPRYDYSGPDARVILTVREGPAFVVRLVTVSGAKVIPPKELINQLPVVAGQRYLPVAAENSLDKIRQLYWHKGYNDVRSDYSLVLDRSTGQVDVAITVNEGRQSIIADVHVAGNDRVNERLVREQVALLPGQPLDISALARSRRNLYDTGAFSVVDIRRRERRGLGDDAAAPEPDERPIDLTVNVREVQPYQLRYGASYDSERGVGAIFDISNRNSLGGAREIGLRSRYDRQLHEARIYLNQPALQYLPKTTFSAYLREELNPPTEITDPFDASRKGVSIQSERRMRNAYVLSYGYRYERAHTLTPLPSGIILDEPLTVSPLTVTLTRETRDEVLDASKGTFLSQSFSYSPTWLGAEDPYTKYFGQYFRYFPLQAPGRRPFTNEILRPRLVYAVGLRIGLSWGMGGDLVPKTERFFAGGSQSLRGFGQNAVGPIGPERVPFGGEAMLILNNEVRVPLISIFDGVAFADLGNVFPRVRNFSFSNIRESAGVGLRVRTRWVLLRSDWGFVLDPRPGEPRSRIYVSIGQAF